MLKRTKLILRKMSAELWGPNAHRKGLTFEGVIALERQKNGNPHSHNLLRSPVPDSRLPVGTLESIASRTGGFCRLEVPRSQADVANYCAKYSIKEGELFFTPNWTPTSAQRKLSEVGFSSAT
jgi:hypothetical protein